MSTVALDVADRGLGSKVLECRRRRRSSVHVDLIGVAGYLQLILFPPILALILTGGVMVLLAKGLNIQGQNTLLASGLAGLFITITVALYFHVFSTPENPLLVLYENGFRHRRRIVLFSNVAAISIGRDNSALAQLARGLGSLMSWHPAARSADNSTRGSVELTFNDSSTVCMKNVLVENNWEDLEEFFSTIERDHSQIPIYS